MDMEAVFREEHGRLLASLARQFGDLDLAEETAAEAMEAALVTWPRRGVPSRPGAWLLTTARRKTVDRLRRDRVLALRLAELQAEVSREQRDGGPTVAGDGLPDERLALFFTCAHPAIRPEDQLALTLRFLAGLTTPEVARALLLPTPTLAQRLVRTKNKIRTARIPFRVPSAGELQTRLPAVLQVVYSVFTEGYAASGGTDLVRSELAEEAIRLGRILRGLLPGQREVTGLLALMLLVHARRDARVQDGEIVLLGDQDRSRWDAGMISEGLALVPLALTGGSPGPYAVQSAIAALHDEAQDDASTDWPQIVALYDVLREVAPSPLVELNRAAALAMRDGPAAGLDALDALAGEPLLRGYHLLPATRADLLRRLGRSREAAAEYRAALELVGNEPERRFLAARLAALSPGPR